MPSPPPAEDKRCRATTKGGMVRGVWWSPPKRCSHWAREDGYCWLHRPPEQYAEDTPPDKRG